MKADLAKMMKDLEQAEDEWELMKEPEKFAKMVVKQSGSGAGVISNLLLLNVMKKVFESMSRMEIITMFHLLRFLDMEN